MTAPHVFVPGDIAQIAPEFGLYGGFLMIVAGKDGDRLWGFVGRVERGGIVHNVVRVTEDLATFTGGRIAYELSPGAIEGGVEILSRQEDRDGY